MKEWLDRARHRCKEGKAGEVREEDLGEEEEFRRGDREGKEGGANLVPTNQVSTRRKVLICSCMSKVELVTNRCFFHCSTTPSDCLRRSVPDPPASSPRPTHGTSSGGYLTGQQASGGNLAVVVPAAVRIPAVDRLFSRQNRPRQSGSVMGHVGQPSGSGQTAPLGQHYKDAESVDELHRREVSTAWQIGISPFRRDSLSFYPALSRGWDIFVPSDVWELRGVKATIITVGRRKGCRQRPPTRAGPLFADLCLFQQSNGAPHWLMGMVMRPGRKASQQGTNDGGATASDSTDRSG
ncbi:uncharacterized protein An11g01670 [Aspergillus niger]|uniref:Contig An11c0050, genomic contig n=2 Tax=Aspergillus niger TaxID=5061 RepID=A2QVJ7_ASPNC|nr:uncharacterized protein An11g01670 [Aspergillus niger]CAK45901.1 unnamed protein product [Aspergillus niger]